MPIQVYLQVIKLMILYQLQFRSWSSQVLFQNVRIHQVKHPGKPITFLPSSQTLQNMRVERLLPQKQNSPVACPGECIQSIQIHKFYKSTHTLCVRFNRESNGQGYSQNVIL